MPVTNADGSLGYRQRKGFTTKTAAKAFLDDRLQHIKARRDPFPEDITFDDYVPKVLDRREKLQVPARNRYEQLMRTHISPVIGSMSVQDLFPGHFEMVLSEMAKKDLARSTIRQARVVMNLTMRRAVKDGLTSVNPVAEVEVPDGPIGERPIPTKAQAQAILQSAEGSRWALPMLLGVRLGLRRSELVALCWGPEGIDLEAGTLRVTRGLHKVSVEREGNASRRPSTCLPRARSPLARSRWVPTSSRRCAGTSWSRANDVC